jgi:hypothetical protein
MVCRYKDIFGKPGTGVHSVRLFDIAVVDVVLTLIASHYIAKRYGFNFYETVFWMFVIGEVAHYIFCVDTKVMRILSDGHIK